MFGAQVSGFRGCVILWGGYFFRAWGFGVLTCHYGSMYPILDVPLLLLPSKSEPYLGGGGGGGVVFSNRMHAAWFRRYKQSA